MVVRWGKREACWSPDIHKGNFFHVTYYISSARAGTIPLLAVISQRTQ